MKTKKIVSKDTPRVGFTTTIEYDSSPQGLNARRVTVESETEPVTSTIFHEVALFRIMRQDMLNGSAASMGLDAATGILRGGTKIPRRTRHTKDFLQAIRVVYEHASANGNPPAQAVAEAAGVSIATAGRLIRKSKNELHWS